jgi:hypothetical protein
MRFTQSEVKRKRVAKVAASVVLGDGRTDCNLMVVVSAYNR